VVSDGRDRVVGLVAEMAMTDTELDKLLEGLREEKDARKEEDASIKSRLDSLTNVTAMFKSGWIVLAIVLAAILGGFSEYWIPKLFGH
jgi:hypothetical protein